MERIFVIVLIIGIVALGLAAGGAGLFYRLQGATADPWSPRNYTAADGQCFVPPQGDPLYDEHYAKNVNVPNCQAFKTQSDAKFVDAQSRNLDSSTQKTHWQTVRENFYTALMGFVFVMIAGFFVLVIVRH